MLCSPPRPARWPARRTSSPPAVVRDHPHRFGQFATMPLPDVPAAVAEARYGLDVLGADGVAIMSNAGGLYPGDPAMDPLLAELDRRAAIVFVHPTAPPNAALVARGRPLPLIEFLFDSARAAVDLVLAGQLHRYPRIRWVLTHGGGVLPCSPAAWTCSRCSTREARLMLAEPALRLPTGWPGVWDTEPTLDGFLDQIPRPGKGVGRARRL